MSIRFPPSSTMVWCLWEKGKKYISTNWRNKQLGSVVPQVTSPWFQLFGRYDLSRPRCLMLRIACKLSIKRCNIDCLIRIFWKNSFFFLFLLFFLSLFTVFFINFVGIYGGRSLPSFICVLSVFAFFWWWSIFPPPHRRQGCHRCCHSPRCRYSWQVEK